MRQAEDFRMESQELVSFLRRLNATRFDESTQFNNWSTHDVIRHLHYWNWMASLQLEDEEKLQSNLSGAFVTRLSMRDVEEAFAPSAMGQDLVDVYAQLADRTADLFATCDPRQRLKWAGPDMSARSSMTARLMETWAHGQELYDHFGVKRTATDQLKNIVVLGVNTFEWTFANRKVPVPGTMPFVRLQAPSGAIWKFGEINCTDSIAGSAECFCQTVTQTRNVADTDLVVTGPIATEWMRYAQCFAGRPVDPPAPGERFLRT